MKHYNVQAMRWERGWELHIDGVGITQSTSLAGAAKAAAEYIELLLGAPDGSFSVTVQPEIAGLDREIEHVRSAITEVARRQEQVAAESRRLVSRLRSSGLSGADVAAVLGISAQRVSQLSRSRTGRSSGAGAVTASVPGRRRAGRP